MNINFKVNFFSIYIGIILLLLILPLILREHSLFFLKLKKLKDYYEIIGSIASGIALIVAFNSIRHQRIELKRQNLRLDYSTQVEALNQIIETQKFILTYSKIKPTHEELTELAELTQKLIEKSKKLLIELENNKT